MFVDKVKIYVKGGDGGKGMVAFRREPFVPDGGPAGGDGGRGGDVIFRVDEGLRTLVDFRFKKHFRADGGEHGKTKNQHGAKADSLIVRVPPGTVVTNVNTGEVIADLIRVDDEAVIAKGGRGGRGNTRFANSRFKAPDIAEKGEPGEELEIQLELKILADVGLVGFPSVGKSTILSVVSAAKPKIAEYHFTTISPNIGVVKAGDDSFVMADLPGLIEGAHLGVGLGHQFLRHIERTRVIVHVVDMSALEGRDPFNDYQQINAELELYNLRLMERPQLIVANKMDMPDAQENLVKFTEELKQHYKENGLNPDDVKIYEVSALTKKGLDPLVRDIATMLRDLPNILLYDEIGESEEDYKVYRAQQEEKPFTISRDQHVYVVGGEKIEKLVLMTDFSREDGVVRFQRILKGIGVDNALRQAGAKEGDTIRIVEMEFEFVD
ncbi:GTPase ObgE [Desulfuribacillus stibiiarsenatis]|uniref:GTPase Obg n=1 Tax=Desulfuribacillus stibiiarsenatis TaxID=1390249 RepID=A0A1E5L267_9FIRM|nr:GTPase ObgE [Desulfuribacillus stibiiarsenatis]OEH84248.1 GTPase ObgE [Desulfuribacillus stibiiarsenatis]